MMKKKNYLERDGENERKKNNKGGASEERGVKRRVTSGAVDAECA